MFNIFKKKREKKNIRVEKFVNGYCEETNFDIIFDSDKFDSWFKKPKEDSYASINIFGRVDKLSDSFFYEYFETYKDIESGEKFAYNYDPLKYYDFKNNVYKNWLNSKKE